MAFLCGLRQFLDRLTPPEWVTDQIRKKRERQRVRMQTRFASKVASWEAETAAAEEAAARREEDEKRKALKEGRVVSVCARAFTAVLFRVRRACCPTCGDGHSTRSGKVGQWMVCGPDLGLKMKLSNPAVKSWICTLVGHSCCWRSSRSLKSPTCF
jgi:hypothetical protein